MSARPERTMTVLEHVISMPHSISHLELSRATGIPRSTLAELLRDLTALGYLRQLQDRTFAPGPKLLAFVYRAVSPQVELLSGFRPALEEVARATGETAAYAVEVPGPDAGSGLMISVGEAQSHNPIRYVADIGVPHPMRETATGLALLGHRNDPTLDPPTRDTIRENGFAVLASDRGSTAIAAPVVDASDQVLGAIAVVGPSSRMADPAAGVWPVLREVVAEIRAAP